MREGLVFVTRQQRVDVSQLPHQSDFECPHVTSTPTTYLGIATYTPARVFGHPYADYAHGVVHSAVVIQNASEAVSERHTRTLLRKNAALCG